MINGNETSYKGIFHYYIWETSGNIMNTLKDCELGLPPGEWIDGNEYYYMNEDHEILDYPDCLNITGKVYVLYFWIVDMFIVDLEINLENILKLLLEDGKLFEKALITKHFPEYVCTPKPNTKGIEVEFYNCNAWDEPEEWDFIVRLFDVGEIKQLWHNMDEDPMEGSIVYVFYGDDDPINFISVVLDNDRKWNYLLKEAYDDHLKPLKWIYKEDIINLE